MTAAKQSKTQKFGFQAEVAKLLHLMVHSVYSNKEIFLRELISNASDACDKLRYAAITEPELTAGGADFRVRVTVDARARTVVVADNGIGMNRDDLIEHLGTIANSGTAAFVEGMKEADASMIGQFGVGFYAAFMVAGAVDVISRKAGEETAWCWHSEGTGEFTIAAAERDGHGTTVTLHLRDEAAEFLVAERLRHIIRTYSDHITLPISLIEAKEDGTRDEESLSKGTALWARPAKDISAEQYKEFYQHVGHMFDEPWTTLHFRAEGVIEYTGLVFIPASKPVDLFDPARKPRIKLYVRRVFIADDCEDLIPGYLRFIRGIVDSQDLPLNISRELLQNNPLVGKIRQGLTKRVLGELAKKAEKDAEGYAKFWDNFGAVLKEGLYEDAGQRERLLGLARFRSTAGDGLVSLADYVGRMKEGQKHIYFITGDDAAAVARSPQLEGFAARGVEVLLLSDPVDDFWLSVVSEFDGKPFRSVTRAGTELDDIKAPDSDGESKDKKQKSPPKAAIGTLIAALKQNLGAAVKDVRVSSRLTDSPVCLVADDGDLDMHIERLLKAQQKLDRAAPRILEINPDHDLVRRLAAVATEKGAAVRLDGIAHLLLDQARIVEGEPVADITQFTRRLGEIMVAGLGVPDGEAAP